MATSSFESYQSAIENRVKKRLKRVIKNGLHSGRNAAKEELKPLMNALKNHIKESFEHKIELALREAEDLVDKKLNENPEIIIGMASVLSKYFSETSDIEIIAHPHDAVLLKEKSVFRNAGSASRTVVMSEDKSLKRGSLLIKANKSIIDASIESKLLHAKELLLT
jgi:flagellar biosynthesis/type III secretory pathway protein FliH